MLHRENGQRQGAELTPHTWHNLPTGPTSEFRCDAFLFQLAESTSKTLPRINDAIEAGSSSITDIIEATRSWLDVLPGKLGHPLVESGMWEARQLVQHLGFWASSIERHTQALGNQPGTGLRLVPALEDALAILGHAAKHPPRDTHYTYWLWNRGEQRLSFTGDPQEQVFNEIVNRTQELHESSCALLRLLCDGSISAFSPLGLGYLRSIAHNLSDLRKNRQDGFLAFMAPREGGGWAMDPHFFMGRMRTYLVTYPILGTDWEGVNATNLAAQARMDYLIGTTDGWYTSVVAKRLRYMTAEDQETVNEDMARQSLGAHLMARLELNMDTIQTVDDHALAALILNQPKEVLLSLSAYADVVKGAAQLSAAHRTLIVNYLVKPSEQLTEDERRKLTVDPAKGVSGTGLEQTERIRQMRHKHPIIGRFVAAIERCVPRTV